MQARTPLALFVYNRPHHIRRAFEALMRCSARERCAITVYCDAPRESSHRKAVAEARAVVAAWAPRLDATVVYQPQNLGLARSIAGGVTDLVTRHGRAIVLEDDLVPSPEFLEFMLAGLDRYENDDRVAQVSGCLLTGATKSQTDGVFLPLTTSWGWATWQRAWSLFRWQDNIDPYELDRDREFRDRFTLGGKAKFHKMLQDRLNGRNDSWAILWWFAVARANKLVLYPRETLVWNGGFDRSGVHCGGLEKFRGAPPRLFLTRRLPTPIRLPETVSIDAAAFEAVRRLFAAEKGATRPQTSRSAVVQAATRIVRRSRLVRPVRKLVHRLSMRTLRNAE